MHPLLHRFIARHEPRHDWRVHAKSAAAATLSVSLVGFLGAITGVPLLLAPLGPTALLIFGQPNSAGAQPINIFAGYLISTLVAVAAMQVVPEPWWLAALAVGVAMLAMLVLRVTHPPALAVPLLILTGPVDEARLFGVLLVACTVLVALGMALHRLPPKVRYPLPLAEEIDKD